MAKTYYELLGVPENATNNQIKEAFRAKSLEVHPDKVVSQPPYLQQVAREAFEQLFEAKSVLLDPERRSQYDQGLSSMRQAESIAEDPDYTEPTMSASSFSSTTASPPQPPPQGPSAASGPTVGTATTSPSISRGWAIGLGCLAWFLFAEIAVPIVGRIWQTVAPHPPDWLKAVGFGWIFACPILVGILVTSLLRGQKKRAGITAGLGISLSLVLALLVGVDAMVPASKSGLADANQVIPSVLNQIYSALNEGRVSDAAPLVSTEFIKSSQSLDYMCRPSTHRAHYIVSIVELQDGAYLVRERALFKPFTESARLLWFKHSGVSYFLYAARDDPFKEEIDAASNTVRQFIYAARAGKWDLVARYASPHFPVDEMKQPEWESYFSKIAGVEIQRYVYNPEVKRSDRGDIREDRGIIFIVVHATLTGHNWFPDFLVDPSTGKIVKAFFPTRMGMYTNTTGAPTADGITSPEIEHDTLVRFHLAKSTQSSSSPVPTLSQEAAMPPAAGTTGTLDAAKRSIPAVLNGIYSALDDARTTDVAPFVSPDIIKSPETLDYLCQPFTYRAHYIVSIVERSDGLFLVRVRALFKPFNERAYLCYFKESEGKFRLQKVEADPFTLEREAAVDAVRQFILAAHDGNWDVVARYASPHLPIDEMKTPEWQQYLSRIEHADGDGQVSINANHGSITLGLRFGVRNFQDPDFLVDPSTGAVIRAFYKVGTSFTNLSSPPNDAGITDPKVDEYTLARFALTPER